MLFYKTKLKRWTLDFLGACCTLRRLLSAYLMANGEIWETVLTEQNAIPAFLTETQFREKPV